MPADAVLPEADAPTGGAGSASVGAAGAASVGAAGSVSAGGAGGSAPSGAAGATGSEEVGADADDGGCTLAQAAGRVPRGATLGLALFGLAALLCRRSRR